MLALDARLEGEIEAGERLHRRQSAGAHRGLQAPRVAELVVPRRLAMMQIDRARQTANQCHRVAEERGEHRIALDAEQILAAIADGMPTAPQMRELFPAFTLQDQRRSSAHASVVRTSPPPCEARSRSAGTVLVAER